MAATIPTELTASLPQPVFVAGFYPPPFTGQGLATARLAELLSTHIDIEAINLRIEEERVGSGGFRRVFHKIRNYVSTGRQLREKLADHPEAVVLWTSISPQPFGHLRDLITTIPAFLRSHRIIAIVHWGSFDRLFTSSLTRRSAKRLLHRLDAVVFVTPDRAAQCTKWIDADKRTIIPNTLDEAVVCSDAEVEIKQNAFRTTRPLRLLFLSNMLQKKGYEDVLKATERLVRQGRSVHTRFIGEWMNAQDEKAFHAYVKRHGLAEFVTHHGAVRDRHAIRQYHLESDIFLLPSYFIEGQPLSIIEALNAGTPVITTKIGGMVDMLDDGVEGLFVQPKDVDGIVDAVITLSHPDTWRTASTHARARFLATYSPDAVRAQWLDLIAALQAR